MESRPGLLRVLGPGMAIAIVVGNVIGSGIYAKPGRIAADAGDVRLVLVAWVGGGIICLFGALCFAELAVMMPRAGGMYVYLREAYGRPVAFLFGWSDFLFGRPASIGALASMFIASLARASGWQLGLWPQVALAATLIGLMAWVNVMGVIWGGRMQGATTLVKAGFLAAVAALPFVMHLLGKATISAANFSTTVEPLQPTLAAQFAVVLLAVMWAYNGWHDVTPVAEEVRNPQRNVPLALLAGIGLLIVLYVSANVAYHAVLPMDAMKQSGDHAAEAMVSVLAGPIGGTVMSVGIMLSTFGAINSNMLLGPRVTFAMGRDDVFLRFLGRVHVNYRTPAIAIVVQAMMSISLFVASAFLVNWSASLRETSVFDLLTNYVTFSASLFYLLAVAAVFVLRAKHPEWERPYRTIGYPLVPAGYIAFYLWFLYYVYAGQPLEARTGLALIAAGIPVYYIYRAWAKRNPQT
ncbi:MAG: amino acid permease [Planctomycetaceae bacterium]